MKINISLSRGNTRNVICVDVQPTYEKYIQFDIEEYCSWLNTQKNILIFYNGDTTVGTDTKEDISFFYLENGLNEEKLEKAVLFDKGYGFFRAWMDLGADIRDIHKIVKELAQKRLSDSREIDVESILKNSFEEWMNDDPIIIPDIDLRQLKKFSGSFLTGGGKNECLAEVKILMDVFNIRYRLVRDFIY